MQISLGKMIGKRYKIALLTAVDPLDKTKLSGTTYYLYKSVQQSLGEVDLLGPASPSRRLLFLIRGFFKLWKKNYHIEHSLILSWQYKRFFEKKLKLKSYDLIIASRASTEIALLQTTIPVIYYTDTTFDSLYNYYTWFSNFMRLSVWEGNRVEKLALEKSAALIFASEWAANSAIQHYHINPGKINIIPFGPNLDYIPASHEVSYERTRDICRLLFLGVEWERKGGSIAFETMQALKNMKIPVLLTVCGCIPPHEIKDECLQVIPYLNKNKPEDSARLVELLKSHHFLLLPTRAECFGVVFAEASAYALPSITTDTGGISSAVQDGKNGYRLRLNAQAPEYASVIAGLFTEYETKYLPLTKKTREFYDRHLNWNVFANSFREVADKVLS
ncbi:MAG: glycosyltransferase family 4 protein [Bacteroidales bacterium]|nr:glycosyltransferase family 4 protein [Bacteroidales bacterium]